MEDGRAANTKDLVTSTPDPSRDRKSRKIRVKVLNILFNTHINATLDDHGKDSEHQAPDPYDRDDIGM